jgi:hypothetical protein
MSGLDTKWLARGLFGLCLAGWATQTVAAAVIRDDVLITVFVLGAFLVAPAVGALIAAREPGNAVGWLLLAGGVAFTAAGITADYAQHSADTQGEWTQFAAIVAFVSLGFFFSLLYILGTLVPLLFPDGKLLSGRWRPAIYVGACGLALFILGSTLNPNELDDFGIEARNPLGIEAIRPLADAAAGLGLLLLLLAAGAAWASLVLRLRRSRREERQQLKWFAFATGISAATLGATGLAWAAGATSILFDILVSVVLLAVVPAAIGIAILRHHLYDIDLLINRTLVYGLLTVATVGSYVSLVIGFSWVARAVSGQGSNELAVAVSTLVVAALIQPARRGIQSGVDRRFYRRHYDVARTLEAFQAQLRDETDLEALRRELVSVTNRTVQPAQSFLWLSSRAARNDPRSQGLYRNARREQP